MLSRLCSCLRVESPDNDDVVTQQVSQLVKLSVLEPAPAENQQEYTRPSCSSTTSAAMLQHHHSSSVLESTLGTFKLVLGRGTHMIQPRFSGPGEWPHAQATPTHNRMPRHSASEVAVAANWLGGDTANWLGGDTPGCPDSSSGPFGRTSAQGAPVYRTSLKGSVGKSRSAKLFRYRTSGRMLTPTARAAANSPQAGLGHQRSINTAMAFLMPQNHEAMATGYISQLLARPLESPAQTTRLSTSIALPASGALHTARPSVERFPRAYLPYDSQAGEFLVEYTQQASPSIAQPAEASPYADVPVPQMVGAVLFNAARASVGTPNMTSAALAQVGEGCEGEEDEAHDVVGPLSQPGHLDLIPSPHSLVRNTHQEAATQELRSTQQGGTASSGAMEPASAGSMAGGCMEESTNSNTMSCLAVSTLLLKQVAAGVLHIAGASILPDRMTRPSWRLRDYTINRKLYKGYSSNVYRATCNLTGEPVALKTYDLRCMPEFLKHQAFREVDVHRGVSHPNIIALYAAFVEEGYLVLVQEYARGGDLHRVTRKLGGRLNEKHTIQTVLFPFLQALHYLHSNEIVHRDIKPANILFTEEWQLKLADFGVAIDMTSERAVTRTGTEKYMAPEVARCPLKHGPEDNKLNADFMYTPAADSWSVGVMAYELLVGVPPNLSVFVRPKDVEPAVSAATGAANAPVLASASDAVDGEPTASKPLHKYTFEDLQELVPFPRFVSSLARDFILCALQPMAIERPTVAEMLRHPWVQSYLCQAPDQEGTMQ